MTNREGFLKYGDSWKKNGLCRHAGLSRTANLSMSL
uniref:PiggyBac transposable elementderived protein 4like [Takifugu rubripes] n=1 Tax=Lepeophtheirus salmonis TaxID=72036 RepID=A0A0K2VLC8_LEPSM